MSELIDEVLKKNISSTNKKLDYIPNVPLPVIAKKIDIIPKQSLQKYISFGIFFSQFNYEAKILFQYMAKVLEYDGGLTELCRLCNYKNIYTEHKTGKRFYNLSQFKRLGIEQLQANGVISVSKQGHGYILKLNPLTFGE